MKENTFIVEQDRVFILVRDGDLSEIKKELERLGIKSDTQLVWCG